MKRLLTISGLWIFLSCFTLFNAVVLLERHHATPDIVLQVIPSSKQTLFLSHSEKLMNNTSYRIWTFNNQTKEIFRNINKEVEITYGISQQNLEELVAGQTGEHFSVDEAADFLRNLEKGEWKAGKFSEYGNWLEGRPVENHGELLSELQQVFQNIVSYSAIPEFGFDRYQIKNLRYSLAKVSSNGPVSDHPLFFLLITIGGMIFGGLFYIIPEYRSIEGVRNQGIFFNPATSARQIGWLIGSWLILFYVVLYFFQEYMTVWVIMTDPVSLWLKGSAGGPFFLYGFMYTLAILVMGVRMLLKYRFSSYQKIRTFSVMFFQTCFAFILPEILLRLNKPYYDFKNMWPLDYDFFFDNELNNLLQHGGLGWFMLGWGVMLSFVAVPVLVYFFGKRWYCSWVCGCGGLAETLGDPFRQLSNKSLKAWKIERLVIHSVLVISIVMTIGVVYTWYTGSSNLAGVDTYSLREWYGAWIGAGFAGVVGTGFYPLMGNRVWCRFGCPLAAWLGIVQRFKSRFRITTNGGQCISCGNCSTYCEMGIDVRWYAQRGQNIVRSSCVGCGICSQVCPRGVLKLENRSTNRFEMPQITGNIKN